jgi:hypothetical protein
MASYQLTTAVVAPSKGIGRKVFKALSAAAMAGFLYGNAAIAAGISATANLAYSSSAIPLSLQYANPSVFAGQEFARWQENLGMVHTASDTYYVQQGEQWFAVVDHLEVQSADVWTQVGDWSSVELSYGCNDCFAGLAAYNYVDLGIDIDGGGEPFEAWLTIHGRYGTLEVPRTGAQVALPSAVLLNGVSLSVAPLGVDSAGGATWYLHTPLVANNLVNVDSYPGGTLYGANVYARTLPSNVITRVSRQELYRAQWSDLVLLSSAPTGMVPESGAVAMALAGLLVVGWAVRRV